MGCGLWRQGKYCGATVVAGWNEVLDFSAGYKRGSRASRYDTVLIRWLLAWNTFGGIWLRGSLDCRWQLAINIWVPNWYVSYLGMYRSWLLICCGLWRDDRCRVEWSFELLGRIQKGFASEPVRYGSGSMSFSVKYFWRDMTARKFRLSLATGNQYLGTKLVRMYLHSLMESCRCCNNGKWREVMSSMTAGETSLAGYNGTGGKFRLSLAISNRKSKREVS